MSKKSSDRQLLSVFVWGNEPGNIDGIRETLEKRGYNIRGVTQAVDALILNLIETKGKEDV